MRSLFLPLISASLLVLGACASPQNDFSVSKGIGRVVQINEPSSKEPYLGTYRPGQGGAIGGVVAAVIVANRSDPYGGWLHYIKIKGQKNPVRVSVASKLASGACVEIKVVPYRADKSEWLFPGDAVLVPAEGCDEA